MFALLALPLLNFLLLAFLVFHYAIEAPNLDQWALVPLLDKAFRHRLTFLDLWRQHNEHRLIFPQLIMIACAMLSGWNIRWELAINLLLGLGIFAVYIAQIRATARQVHDATVLRLLPVVGLTVFSLRQHENWDWGWQLQIFLNILAVVAGTALLAQPALNWPRLATAMLCGIVATYSFANGLCFWFAGALVIGLQTDCKPKRAFLLTWGVVALITIASFLYQFRPGDAGVLPYALRHPFAVAYYVCGYMGSLLMFKFNDALAALFGIAGLCVFCVVTRRLLTRRQTPLAVLSPYYGLAAYALFSALVSAAGRVVYGSVQALAPRYTTISQLFWIALFMLLYLSLRQSEQSPTVETAQPRRPLALSALVVCGLLIAFSSLRDAHQFKDHYNYLLPDQEAMRQGSANIPGLADTTQHAAEGIAILHKWHLNLFRDSAP